MTPMTNKILYSPNCREQSFSETEELLFVLPSPLIYYPLNERKPWACTSPASLPGVDSSWSTASLRLAAAASAAAGRCTDRGGATQSIWRSRLSRSASLCGWAAYGCSSHSFRRWRSCPSGSSPERSATLKHDSPPSTYPTSPRCAGGCRRRVLFLLYSPYCRELVFSETQNPGGGMRRGPGRSPWPLCECALKASPLKLV
jgi:hypothetical protein